MPLRCFDCHGRQWHKIFTRGLCLRHNSRVLCCCIAGPGCRGQPHVFNNTRGPFFASHYVISLERSFFQAGKPPGLRLDRTALLFTSLRPSLTWCGRIENIRGYEVVDEARALAALATIAGRRKESIYSVESCCCSFFRLPSSLSCSQLSHNWHRRLTLLPRRRR